MNMIKQWTESPILSFLQFSQIPCVSATRVYPMNTPPQQLCAFFSEPWTLGLVCT